MDAEQAWMSDAPHVSTNIPPTWTTTLTPVSSFSPMSKLLLFFLVFNLILVNFCFFRLASVLSRQPMCRRPPPLLESPTHLLVVLGSGGHTAEMLNILTQYDRLQLHWTHRTYLVSSGDGFSAGKAKEFEAEMSSTLEKAISEGKYNDEAKKAATPDYDIVTVHRARRVHQSLLTTPISSLRCLWDCVKVLRGTHPDFQHDHSPSYPDLILTNGPGTGVIVILASILLLFFGLTGTSASLPRSKKVMRHASSSSDTSSPGQMRSIYIESWARVKTLSLSGRLLKPVVDRFIVQWPQLAEKERKSGKVDFVGGLVT